MPLRTAIFRRADSSQKAKYVQKVGFIDLYFIKAEFSAFFCFANTSTRAKILKYFAETESGADITRP